MRVRWTPPAEDDRAAIIEYIADRDPDAAIKLDDRFDEVAMKLGDFPMMGHAGAIPGTREFSPHRSYRLVYQIVDETVWIVMLIHGAREWPPKNR